jgi:predicted nucleic acid-binding protein
VKKSTTMSIEPGFLDANILVYALNVDAPQYPACRSLLDAGVDPTVKLYVTSQILCEFYSIITNPRRVATVSSPAEALDIIAAVLDLPGVQVLPIPPEAVERWMNLLRRRPVKGANIFDLQIVAAMQANGIQRIYTYNTADFEAFSELAVLTP